MSSMRIWMHLMWSSCTRSAQRPAGVTMDTSASSVMGVSSRPVSATTLTPFLRATSAALTMLRLVPDVVGTTVAAVAARHLLRKMHGVAETAAVAAAHHLAVALDGVRHEACRRHDGFNRLLVGDQGVERIACVIECGQNVCFFHVGPL